VFALLRHDATEGQDVCCVVVQDVRSGKQAVNFSQARQYPLAEVQAMKREGVSNGSIGEFCKRWYEEKGFPVSRCDQIRTATAAALALV